MKGKVQLTTWLNFFFGVQIFSQLAHETHETSGVHG